MRYPRAVAVFLLTLAFFSFTGCGQKRDDRIELTIWGIGGGESGRGQMAAIHHFEEMHPNIKVVPLYMGAGQQPQKLLTAIVGKVPPDVIQQDSYTVNDWAARDAFIPLNDLIERDLDKPNPVILSDFVQNSLAEVSHQGKVYAIPYRTDGMMMYYNKKLFREAGLDPERPPMTWDELKEHAIKLTKYNPDGSFKTVGYIPFQGIAGLCLFAWVNGGEFFNEDLTKCTMDDPRIVEALEYIVSFYDEFKGAEALNSFTLGLRTEAMDPFIIEKVAITTNTPGLLETISRYAPDLDFGVAPFPVPKARYEGKPPFTNTSRWTTWAGGFSFAIPRGAKHKEEAWEFVKWITSKEGWEYTYTAQRDYNLSKGRPFIARSSANLKTNAALLDKFSPMNPKFRDPMRLYHKMLPLAKYRPASFISARWYNEHMNAAQDAIFHVMAPEEALKYHTSIVQKEMDKVFEREKYPILNWYYPLAIVISFIILLIIFLYNKFKQFGSIGKMSQGETSAGLLFISPWVIGFLIFIAGPIIASIVFSFCDYDVLHPARWVGLANYACLFGEDWNIFGKSLLNIGFLALFGLPLGLAVSLSVALLLNSKVLGMTWYRTIYYLPSIVPVVVNSLLWVWVLNPQYGLINTAWSATITNWFNIQPPLWLAAENSAKPALVFMGLWGAGGGMILWLAGLQGVPQHLYEAAEIDGAGWWKKFWSVTIPMLTPYIFFNMIMGVIGILQTFETIFIMTDGGPANNATMVPVLMLFKNAFYYFKLGYASSIAWVVFLIILALTIIQMKLSSRWVHYEADSR